MMRQKNRQHQAKKYFPIAKPKERGCHSWIFAMFNGWVVAIRTG